MRRLSRVAPPWDMAQRLDTDLGKIIHITPDGAPAKDNPFIGKTGALPEIWSIGHRSEEGLTIDPATGQLWENENGPRGGDKLIKVEAGQNYGWVNSILRTSVSAVSDWSVANMRWPRPKKISLP